MKNKPFLIVFFLMLASLSFSWALAETLTLRDGRVFNGTYLGGTSRTIRFRTEGVIKTFRLDEVQDLAFVNNLATTSSGVPSTQYEVRSGARADQYGNYSGARGDSRSYRRAAVRDEYVIPSGTVLRVRTNESIDSEVAHVGDTFSGTLDSDIVVNNELLAERGSPVKLRIAETEQAGKFE